MGTFGTGPPSTGFSCVPGISADDEVISSPPPNVLSIGSGGEEIDVEGGMAELYVESSAGFTVEDAESAIKISIFRQLYTLVAADSKWESRSGWYCNVP